MALPSAEKRRALQRILLLILCITVTVSGLFGAVYYLKPMLKQASREITLSHPPPAENDSSWAFAKNAVE